MPGLLWALDRARKNCDPRIGHNPRTIADAVAAFEPTAAVLALRKPSGRTQ